MTIARTSRYRTVPGGMRSGTSVRRALRGVWPPHRPKITVPPGAGIGLPAGLIPDIAVQIVREFNPVRIVLFGSRGRGDARPDSDVDLFVEMETRLDRFERSAAVGAIFDHRPWALDIVVYTPQETKRAIRNAGFLIDAIESEGRTLYARK